MSEASHIATDTQTSVIKLKNSLDQLSDRIATNSDSSLILSEAMAMFSTFFNEIGNPEFAPEELITGDTPRSSVYNQNLKQIYNDISRFYQELKNLSAANIKSFNYSQVVISEIKKRAEYLSSIVLDLNILNNFTRGDVIVAGDDFTNLDNLDKSAALSSPMGELLSGGAGLALARSQSENISNQPRVEVEVIPIAPTNSTSPTPGNIGRFYEGNFYNLLGFARPEGGSFNLRYQMVPTGNKIPVSTTVAGPTSITQPGLVYGPVDPQTPPPVMEDEMVGIYLDYGATVEDRKQARKKILDNNPDTFWECEYLIKLNNPLLNVDDSIVYDANEELPDDGELGFSDPDAPTGASIDINSDELNNRAQLQDTVDLVIDLIITLPNATPINMVSINPVLFGSNAFLEVQDLSTADEVSGTFTTVDGWNQLKYPKSLTPEANEYLTDSQLSATLSPNRSNYLGQGVFPFPLRVAKKVKLRLSVSQPINQIYERTYVLLKNTLDITTTVTTTTKRGALRF